MIATLRGRVMEIDMTRKKAILDVNGVGYEVCVHNRDATWVGSEQGKEIFLCCALVIREDSWDLYGFRAMEDKIIFGDLISVAGIGAKMAMAIIGHASIEDISRAVSVQDVRFFQSIPGIGPKLASRLATELQHHIAKWPALMSSYSHPDSKIPDSFSSSAELRDLLTNLGYLPLEIMRMMQAASGISGFRQLSLEEQLRVVLEQLPVRGNISGQPS